MPLILPARTLDSASDIDALANLFNYTTTDGVTSRPLGEFPVKE